MCVFENDTICVRSNLLFAKENLELAIAFIHCFSHHINIAKHHVHILSYKGQEQIRGHSKSIKSCSE